MKKLELGGGTVFKIDCRSSKIQGGTGRKYESWNGIIEGGKGQKKLEGDTYKSWIGFIGPKRERGRNREEGYRVGSE